MKLLEILIIAALVIFPFGELLRFNIGNNIVIKPLDILAGIISFYWLLLLVTKKVSFPAKSWYFLLFPIACLLSLLANVIWLQPNQLLASSLYLVRWVSYLGVFFAVVQATPQLRKRIISLLLLDGLIIVLLGYLQYFFFSDLKPLYYLGWDDHMYRLFSVFLDPNFTGAIFVLYLLFVCGLIYQRLQLDRKLKHYTVFLIVVAILTLVALFLTFSRSSLLMLIAGASIFFILIGQKKLILMLLGAILVFILLISSQFYVENMNLFRSASSTARLGNIEVALTIFQKHPLAGVGFNTYRYAKEQYNIQSGWVDAPSHADAGVDNSFLFVLVTTGIIGFIAYLYLWFRLFKRAYGFYRKDKNMFAAVFIASGTGLFVHALFINSLFFPAILFWMWLMNGLMERR